MKTRFFLLITILLTWSCSKDDETFSISVDRTSIEVEAEASIISISITSNDSWTVKSDVGWLSTTTRKGNGNQNLSIKVSENTTNEARTGMLTFAKENGTGLEATAKVMISQSQNDVILVSGNRVNSTWAGGEFEISYQDNIVTTATISEGTDWVHIISTNETRALSQHSLRIKVDKNTGVARECTIILEGGTTSKTIAVEQEAFVPIESIAFSTSTLSISDDNPHSVYVTIIPENASDKELIWSTEGTDIVTLEDNDLLSKNIVATHNGETTVTVKNP